MPATQPKKKTRTPLDAATDPRAVTLFLEIKPTFTVDKKNGRLERVAILSGNREALGHGVWLDDKTLEMALAAVQSAGGRMQGAIRHGSIWDFIRHGRDRVLEIPGFFDKIARAGDSIVGDFEFFESFRHQQKDTFERLMEMARKTPDLFGLSAEPSGYLVFIDNAGTEYMATRDPETGEITGAPPEAELAHDGLPVFRITRMRVAAFVDQPAANDGLFARFSSALGLDRLFGAEQGAPLDLGSVLRAFVSFAESDAGRALIFPSPSSSDATSPNLVHDNAALMNILAELKAKIGADKDRLTRALALLSEDPTRTLDQLLTLSAPPSAPAAAAPPPSAAKSVFAVVVEKIQDKDLRTRAFALLSEHPDFTFEQIEAEFARQDRDELAHLRAENEALKTVVAEKDKAIASLRTDGHPATLRLGAPSAGTGLQNPPERKGLARVAAAFAADAKNPAPLARN